MELYDNLIEDIRKDLNIISLKIDTTIGDGLFPLLYLFVFMFILIITFYDNPYWSYILLIILLMIFLSVFTKKSFTKINFVKDILNIIIKPLCFIFILIGRTLGIFKLLDFDNKKILFLTCGGFFALLILFIIIYNIFKYKIKCKYDLNEIKKNNLIKFNDDSLTNTGQNECNILDLDKCYTLDELQPCFKQLTKDKNEKCNYCLDYYTFQCKNITEKTECEDNNDCSYDDNNDLCIKKQCNETTEESDCNERKNCFYDNSNKQCKEKLNSSDKFCSNFSSSDYNLNNIKCKDKDYCQNKLDLKYCSDFVDVSTYSSTYIILNIIMFFILIPVYYMNCISNKSFVLIILLINILCLILFIFLQNTGYTKSQYMDKN